MTEGVRGEIIAAICAVLYVDEADFAGGDDTDLRDLGLDSIRFVLLMKRLGVDRESATPALLSETLTVAAWVRILETGRDLA